MARRWRMTLTRHETWNEFRSGRHIERVTEEDIRAHCGIDDEDAVCDEDVDAYCRHLEETIDIETECDDSDLCEGYTETEWEEITDEPDRPQLTQATNRRRVAAALNADTPGQSRPSFVHGPDHQCPMCIQNRTWALERTEFVPPTRTAGDPPGERVCSNPTCLLCRPAPAPPPSPRSDDSALWSVETERS